MGKRGGFRQGAGRPPGRKGDAVIAREMETKAEQLRTRGKRSDLDVMLEIRDFWMGAAAKEQTRVNEFNEKNAAEPSKPAKERTIEPAGLDRDLMFRALELAGAMAAKRAPFLHHKLSTRMIVDDPMDLSKLSDAELDFIDRIRAKASAAAGSNGFGTGATTH